MYCFQILLNPAILSADKHWLPKPTWRQRSGGNPVIFLSGKDVFLTLSLAWSCCVVISKLSHLVSSCSTCKSLKAHEREGLKRFFWRCLKLRYPVVSCDWRSWPVSGEAFLFVLHVYLTTFQEFFWLWGSRHVLSSHFGTHGTVDYTDSSKLHENLFK